jgi:sulfur carrier protein
MPDQLNLQLNGEARRISADTTIASLLAAEGLAERRVAVEVNGAIVPRAQHPLHVLLEGDRVEIVHALGGG